MEFKLNEHHRNTTDQELLDDIKIVADLLGTEILSRDMYNKNGKFSGTTIERRFGTWNLAIEKAGLIPVPGGGKNAYNINVSSEQLLKDLYETAKKLGLNTITTTQYAENGKHGNVIIIERFGKWETALLKAGLEPTGFHSKLSPEELLEEIERIWIKLGRQPTTTDIKNGVSKYSLNSYARKFGSWRKALETFVEYINQDENKSNQEIIPSVEDDSNSSEVIFKPKFNTRTTKRDINLRLRFLIMKRDNFKCCMCGRSPATTPNLELHIDHIKPWAKGGETVPDNLQTLCSDCNLGKSDIE